MVWRCLLFLEVSRSHNFSSEVLKEDYTIAGAISATIYASTTTSNLGIIATVCDVCGLGKVEVAKGDTRHIAEKIVKAKGYDICQVDTVAPYTGTYGEIVDWGHEEVIY